MSKLPIHLTCCRAGFNRSSSRGGALFYLAYSAVRAFSASLDRRPMPGLGSSLQCMMRCVGTDFGQTDFGQLSVSVF